MWLCVVDVYWSVQSYFKTKLAYDKACIVMKKIPYDVIKKGGKVTK